MGKGIRCEVGLRDGLRVGYGKVESSVNFWFKFGMMKRLSVCFCEIVVVLMCLL